MRDWQSLFNTWWKPLSDTEGEKCDRAARMIREAIAASDALKAHKISVFAQGSYRNETNVRQDSDVDICVCCTDVVITDFSHTPGVTKEMLGYTPSSYTRATFRDDVAAALEAKFGKQGFSRGDKAFEVHENTARVDADVVAAFEHRLFYADAMGGYAFRAGTNIRADSGKEIMNFPQQHYDNGVFKNAATNKAFKRVVRVMKRLRNEMVEAKVAAANPIPSYLIECLLWNVPDTHLIVDAYYKSVRDALAYLYGQLNSPGATDKWFEINGIKYLFHSTQPWTREQALGFVVAAWQYVGFN